MAKKKTTRKPAAKAARKRTAKKPAAKKAKPARKAATKKPTAKKKPAAKKTATKKAASKPAVKKKVKTKAAVKKKSTRKTSPARKSGTTASKSGSRPKLGRSRIPIDAPLDAVFQHDVQAREAFNYLGIRTIRELQAFGADELILRLTSPTKQTVGRIRKVLALNNRSLTNDEKFAIDFQQRAKR